MSKATPVVEEKFNLKQLREHNDTEEGRSPCGESTERPLIREGDAPKKVIKVLGVIIGERS